MLQWKQTLGTEEARRLLFYSVILFTYFIQLVSIASVPTLYLSNVSISSYGPPWSLKSKIACVPVAYIFNINSIESLRMGINVKINREVAI